MRRREFGHGWVGVAVGAWLTIVSAGVSFSQEAAPPAVPRNQARGAGEVARLFDAYALMQAQETLGLDEAQYAKFVGRFRALSDARRRHQVNRARIVQDLARLTRGDGPFNEDTLGERMKVLEDEDTRARGEIATALESVDELLTLPQRARFRVLEDQLERRKWELMARARQAGRAGQGQGPGRRVEPR